VIKEFLASDRFRLIEPDNLPTFQRTLSHAGKCLRWVCVCVCVCVCVLLLTHTLRYLFYTRSLYLCGNIRVDSACIMRHMHLCIMSNATDVAIAFFPSDAGGAGAATDQEDADNTLRILHTLVHMRPWPQSLLFATFSLGLSSCIRGSH
jgi:hypothetical protein